MRGGNLVLDSQSPFSPKQLGPALGRRDSLENASPSRASPSSLSQLPSSVKPAKSLALKRLRKRPRKASFGLVKSPLGMAGGRGDAREPEKSKPRAPKRLRSAFVDDAADLSGSDSGDESEEEADEYEAAFVTQRCEPSPGLGGAKPYSPSPTPLLRRTVGRKDVQHTPGASQAALESYDLEDSFIDDEEDDDGEEASEGDEEDGETRKH
ncbi:hypothetical protein H632_c308p0 [Helicosporidium sp. ATCC 50920]|nr:hypothetical protein H632_c308p0 [Helicosporidium sp. ATCC 50920]|eukprot:KDD76225.1 hypothetical protein H632_c308p0 [Helicosporidium sp. ATCC 50920]